MVMSSWKNFQGLPVCLQIQRLFKKNNVDSFVSGGFFNHAFLTKIWIGPNSALDYDGGTITNRRLCCPFFFIFLKSFLQTDVEYLTPGIF